MSAVYEGLEMGDKEMGLSVNVTNSKKRSQRSLRFGDDNRNWRNIYVFGNGNNEVDERKERNTEKDNLHSIKIMKQGSLPTSLWNCLLYTSRCV